MRHPKNGRSPDQLRGRGTSGRAKTENLLPFSDSIIAESEQKTIDLPQLDMLIEMFEMGTLSAYHGLINNNTNQLMGAGSLLVFCGRELARFTAGKP